MKRVFLNSRMAAVVLLMLDLLVLDSFRFYTGKWGARMPDNLTFRTTTSPSATISQVSELYKETDSARLKKARLRLAEVQGRIPMGASELSEQELADMKLTDSPSKIREIAWKVAEPEVKYDPALATSRLFYQPLVWIERNLKIFVPLTAFVGRLLLDVVTNQEEARRTQRANELLQILGDQSPALIKAGQSLSSRSDLLPAAYLEALQKLQDRCPPYPTAQAMALFEAQLGLNFNDVFELDSPEPIAAASIGQVCIVYCAMLARVLTYLRLQVYKARLRSNGAYVAIKIQRPHCEESVAVDLFVLRWYAMRVQSVFTLLKRDVNLTSVVDDFGELLYRELDYRAEALNAQRFAELYASFKDVFVPKIYTSLSTSKVLVMEWVDGVRLSDATAITAMGYNSSRFVDTLVQCSMRQMLENGFFHADPHAGNLLAMPSGKLCYLDFGMVSYVEPAQRYSIIEAVVHMVNRDFSALAGLYKRMGFIPADVDIAPIVAALETALPDVLNSAVGDFNFKNVIGKLGDVMYKFPFSLPPYYIAIIRCLGVLEGLAIQVDKDFRIISDAYPYIASRLLTDPSAELQAALQQLLFTDDLVRWDRLQDLLQEATLVGDYDLGQAVDQLVAYLGTERGQLLRGQLVTEAVQVLDTLEVETAQLLDGYRDLLLRAAQIAPAAVLRLLFADSDATGKGRLQTVLDALGERFLKQVQRGAPQNSTLQAFARTVTALGSMQGMDQKRTNQIIRKVLKEPALTAVLSEIASRLAERLAARLVRRLLGDSATPAVVAKAPDTNTAAA